jgi:hypothetical protein
VESGLDLARPGGFVARRSWRLGDGLLGNCMDSHAASAAQAGLDAAGINRWFIAGGAGFVVWNQTEPRN